MNTEQYVKKLKNILGEEEYNILFDKIFDEAKKKFKNSPFISPVYGIEKEKKDPVTPVVPVHADSIELEQTANLEKLDQEIKKTNEFLKVLKELQKNLD